MSKQSRAGKIFLALLVVFLVAGLRVWYYSDSSPLVLVAVVFISLIVLGLQRVFSDGSEHSAKEDPHAPTPPSSQSSRTTINFNGKSYPGLSAMPLTTLREFLSGLERFALVNPKAFPQKLLLMGRIDLAGDFEASLLSYNLGQLTKEELDARIRWTIVRLEASVVSSPLTPARLPAPLIDFTHEGVTYTYPSELPPRARYPYKKTLERILLEDPVRFDDMLKKHGLEETLVELNETQRLRSLDLITQREYEAALQQILSRLAD